MASIGSPQTAPKVALKPDRAVDIRPQVEVEAPQLEAPVVRASEHGARGITAGEVVTALAKSEVGQAAGKKLRDLQIDASDALAKKSPGLKAAIDAAGPHAAMLLQLTATKLANDPDAIAAIAKAAKTMKPAQVAATLKRLAPKAGKAFSDVSGLQAMNPEVVSAVLKQMPEVAAKLAPKYADDVAKACTKAGVKLGLQATKTGSKAVPVLGNAVAVASTLLAAAGLAKALKNGDKEGMAKEGLNTLLQTIGIGFPWVALGGDLVDLGWTASKVTREAGKTPKASTEAKAVSAPKDMAPMVASSADVLASVLEGAGKGDLAKQFRSIGKEASNIADGKKGHLDKATKKALTAYSKDASIELKKAADSAEGEEKATLTKLSEAFGQVFATFLAETKSPTASVDRQARGGAALVDALAKTAP